MDAADVLELLGALAERSVVHWVDGGWGVDALLGVQTRGHGDLDLVVSRSDLAVVRDLLVSRGYAVIRDLLPTAVAFRDATGREVDLHPIDPTPDGGGDQALPEGGAWHYSPPVHGVIAGRGVRCCSAQDQLQMHRGYAPRAVDRHDMGLLEEWVGLTRPESFQDPTPA